MAWKPDMTDEQVKELPPLKRFLWWIKERHTIYLKKQAGQPKPWTKSRVLQSYFFTNPYRENDKVTVWFRDNVRDPLRDDPSVLFATVAFRWFNLPRTGEVLMDGPILSEDRSGCLLLNWDQQEAVERLREHNKQGPVFTGAYMIKPGNGPPGCKISLVCAALTQVWNNRQRLLNICKEDCRLQALWSALKNFRGLGGFMSYEVVCDLRHTYLLEHATDINTWANPGPGALRGLQRLQGGLGTKVANPLGKMVELLAIMRLVLHDMPTRFELREAEHSLCEWDKMERALWNDGGRMKRRYPGV